jgi:hypothetical protein
MSGTKVHSNYEDLLTFTRASGGHALRPISYGDELVENGDFATDSDWTKGTGWTISGGKASIDGTQTAASRLRTISEITLTAGAVYLVQIDITSISAGSFTLSLTGTGASDIVGMAEVGSYSVTLVAPSTSEDLLVEASSNCVGSVDNISLKEVTFDQPDGTLTLFEHPVNVPRVEWDSAGNRLGLLVEEARTNLITHSEDFSQWIALGATVNSNNVISPDKNLNGTKLTSSGSGTQRVGRNISTTGVNCYSVFAKKGTHSYLQILDGSDAQYYVNFDLDSGSVGTSGSKASGQIQDFGNGWYRCTMVTDGTSSTSNLYIYLASSASSAYANSTTSTDYFYIWGAQLEAGSFPTSYIKTTGATATRSADVASIPVSDFGFNNSNEGSLFVECADISFKAGGTTYPVILQIGNGLNANDRRGFFIAESANQVAAEVISSGVGAAYLALDTHTNGRIESTKLAFRMAENNFAGTDDGTSVVTDTSGTVTPSSSLSIIGIGRNTTGGGHLNGHIKSIKYYPRRLTDAQLQALTEPRSTPTLSLTFDGLESSYTENYIHG